MEIDRLWAARLEGFDLRLEQVMELWGGVVGQQWRNTVAKQFQIYRGNG